MIIGKNLDKKFKDKIFQRFDKFINSNYKRLSIFDTEKEKEILNA